MSTPLAIIPTFLRSDRDLHLVRRTVETLRETADVDLLVVDDGSPSGTHASALASILRQGEMIAKPENTGFSQTVNIGLRRALREERDALLINADVEFNQRSWLDYMLMTEAAVVGAKLLYPNNLVQHAGVYYSLLHRTFEHIGRCSPVTLPELCVPRRCPVTGALMLIRYECLQSVGVFDEAFKMGYEDVDYCCRVFKSGRECIMNPSVMAVHHERQFRFQEDDKGSRWFDISWDHFNDKWAGQDIGQFAPFMRDTHEGAII